MKTVKTTLLLLATMAMTPILCSEQANKQISGDDSMQTEKFDIVKFNKNAQNTGGFYEYRDSDSTTITYANHGSDYMI